MTNSLPCYISQPGITIAYNACGYMYYTKIWPQLLANHMHYILTSFSHIINTDIIFFEQVVEKKTPEERVGIVVKCDGKYQVSTQKKLLSSVWNNTFKPLNLLNFSHLHINLDFFEFQ